MLSREEDDPFTGVRGFAHGSSLVLRVATALERLAGPRVLDEQNAT